MSVAPRTVLDVDGQAGGDGRTGTPVPGRTVPEVVSQLAWRVLGPYKDRARSVLDWAGLTGQPAGTLTEVARRYGVTSRAVGQRVQRVGRAGAALPLHPRVQRELTRPARNGDDDLTRNGAHSSWVSHPHPVVAPGRTGNAWR